MRSFLDDDASETSATASDLSGEEDDGDDSTNLDDLTSATSAAVDVDRELKAMVAGLQRGCHHSCEIPVRMGCANGGKVRPVECDLNGAH